MEFNKIAAAFLIAGIIAMLSGIIADALYSPAYEVEKRGFSVAVTETTHTEAQAEEKPVDIKALMAKADAMEGQKTAKACQMCHNFDKGGATKVGPDLWGVVGAEKGRHADFSYSKALKEKGGVWDYDSLYHMIHKPREFIEGTKMSFIGIKNPQDIANVIAYLRSLSDNPLQLP